jgi:HlyD family secretion protein
MGSRWKKRLVIIAAILILVSAGGFFTFRMIDANGGDQKFRKLKIERGEISSSVTATGTINPVVNVLVGSQVSGTIKALYADFNSQVKEGQVIAQIDPAIFEAQVAQGRANLLSAQANLLNVQANLKNVQASLAKAEVAVQDTKRTLDRNKELAERKVVAQATLDTAQANYDSAVAQRDSSTAQIESAKAQIEQAKAQIEQARASLRVSETNLRYATIRSPVNGTVISRNVDVGQTVAASLQAPTLFTIAKDLTQMQVDSNISEADVGRIAVGQDSTFTVDAYPERTFRGKVSEIRNAPMTVQNVVTYDVVIRVDNKELKLKPGMTANVSVLIAHKEGVLKIPNSALRFQPQSAAREQTGEKSKGASPPGGGGQRPIDRLTKELNLTDEQRTKAEMILASSRQEIQEIREKAKPEDARIKIQNLIKQKIWGVLTEEQKRKYGEMGQGQSSPQGEERRPARVWVVSPEGKPAPVSIFLGITNGTFSEVAEGDLKEGMEVIVEELSKKKNSAQRPSAPPGMRGLGR